MAKKKSKPSQGVKPVRGKEGGAVLGPRNPARKAERAHLNIDASLLKKISKRKMPILGGK